MGDKLASLANVSKTRTMKKKKLDKLKKLKDIVMIGQANKTSRFLDDPLTEDCMLKKLKVMKRV